MLKPGFFSEGGVIKNPGFWWKDRCFLKDGVFTLTSKYFWAVKNPGFWWKDGVFDEKLGFLKDGVFDEKLGFFAYIP